MIDLKEVITKYPECLENAAKLRAYLGDLYPAEKARINVLTALMSMGAAEEIRNTERLDKLVVSNYCSKLLNEYGYAEKLSAECVELWHTTYVKRQEVQASPQIVPAAKTSGFYSKVAGVTFEGRQSFIAEMHRKGSTALTLERDRNNPYDVNAVAVINECGWQIGWLPKDIASQIAPQMDAGIQVTAKVSAINIGEAGYNSGVSIYIEVGGGNATAEEKGEAVNQRKHTTPLNEFEIKDGVLVKYIGTAVNVVIPDCVTSIGACAFQECTSLVSVTIPNSVTSIGERAFCGCKSIKSIVIPSRVTVIDDYTFAFCGSLESITIPDSVTTIGECAFYSCETLKSVELPDSISEIEAGAFLYCRALRKIKIPDSVVAIGEDAFKGCDYLLL